MKTESLKALGLTDEQIAAVMKENGLDIAAEQKKATKLEVERDNYKAKLETAQETLKGFDGVDVNELKGKIDALTADLAKKDSEYKTKIADMEFNAVLDAAVSGSKAKNAKAVRALLDVDSIKASKNQSDDIKAAIEKVKSENDFLFYGTSVPGGGGNPPGADTGITKEAFAKMGYGARVKLKQTDPEKYNEMKGD